MFFGRKQPERKNLVVYTAIFGGYDQLQEPLTRSVNCDYICFTDDPNLRSDFWTVKLIQEDKLSPARLSRRPKILPHLYLLDYDASLYIDGNLLLIGDVNTYVETYARTSPMLCVKHGERDCVYQEYQACRESQRDDLTVMQNQIERYQREGMPPDLGLIVGSFIYRRHHDPAVIRVMDRWWDEFTSGSQRDQLSFTYSCWKERFHYDLYYANNWSNDYFLWLPHRISGNTINLPYHRERLVGPKARRSAIEKAAAQRTIADRARMPAKFYIDFGQGLAESNVIYIAPDMDGRMATYRLAIPQGTKAIRFDPIEGSQVAIRDLTVTLDEQALDILPANGQRKDGIDWFETTDPQYKIAVSDMGKVLEIALEMQVK
jgi:hypothetical protein